MTSWTSFGMNWLAAGEGGLLIRPRHQPTIPLMGVMFVHGAGSGATYCLDPYGRQCLLTKAIADAGFTCFSGDIGGPATWGDSTAMSRMNDAYNFLQCQPGVKSGKIALIFGSMGGLTSLNWAAAHPTLVGAVAGVIPVINLNDIVTYNRGGYGGVASAAYAGGYTEAAYGSTNNPRTMAIAGKYWAMPMLFFYGTTDSLCIPSETQAFAASVGPSITLVPLATGHEEASYSACDHPRVVAFLLANS